MVGPIEYNDNTYVAFYYIDKNKKFKINNIQDSDKKVVMSVSKSKCIKGYEGLYKKITGKEITENIIEDNSVIDNSRPDDELDEKEKEEFFSKLFFIDVTDKMEEESENENRKRIEIKKPVKRASAKNVNEEIKENDSSIDDLLEEF